uniref:Cadherin domain-containing protein n=1 Tax=Plectus sambesii TaxID=2011161 RepID=A0A914WMC8_9BILA
MSSLPKAIAIWIALLCSVCHANEMPVFVRNMDGVRIADDTKPGSVVFQLEGTDSESEVYYGLEGSEGILSVDPRSGVVTLQKSLNHLVSRLFLHHDTGILQGRNCALK